LSNSWDDKQRYLHGRRGDPPIGRILGVHKGVVLFVLIVVLAYLQMLQMLLILLTLLLLLLLLLLVVLAVELCQHRSPPAKQPAAFFFPRWGRGCHLDRIEGGGIDDRALLHRSPWSLAWHCP
jgi:hypothetical protein